MQVEIMGGPSDGMVIKVKTPRAKPQGGLTEVTLAGTSYAIMRERARVFAVHPSVNLKRF